jgi:hypothetical protein
MPLKIEKRKDGVLVFPFIWVIGIPYNKEGILLRRYVCNQIMFIKPQIFTRKIFYVWESPSYCGSYVLYFLVWLFLHRFPLYRTSPGQVLANREGKQKIDICITQDLSTRMKVRVISIYHTNNCSRENIANGDHRCKTSQLRVSLPAASMYPSPLKIESMIPPSINAYNFTYLASLRLPGWRVAQFY